ncbi:type II secretion system secretin GspD [Flocculibacter collagenilyticus]|uniref:type II secretion system secretin GspD n=1 Tax=Flocculibacter collagenilyticus TaxID=2744479 RepID=UPI0018F2F8AD|nr:type II secretion system secretin GspD [Flocculibacter collagenilyticus]
MLKIQLNKTLKKLAVAISTAVISFQVCAVQYSANFKGTEINEFINIVGKNLQKTIIIDPNVRGKVNVRSYELLDEKQYYQFFLNVLEVYGFAIVEMDNGIAKVVRQKDAKTSSIPVVGDENPGFGDEMVTRVVPVKNVSVRELSPLLRQFSNQAQGGHVVHYDPSNVIMMTGPAATVNRLVEIINRVDRAGDQKVEIISLKFASAGEMVRIVENIYKSTNTGKGASPSFLIPKIVADERTNSVLVSGEPQAREKVSDLVRRLDSELENNGNTKVIYLQYAKAEELVKVLEGVSESIQKEDGTTSKARKSSKRDVSIDAHADSNALVITAQPDTMRSLEDVIKRLDVRRAQVLVEAIIVEVFEGDGVNLGVQWISEDGGMMQFNNGTTVPVSSVAAAAAAAEGEKGKTTVTIVDGNPVTVTEPDQRGDYSILAQLLGSVNGIMAGVVKDDWGAIIQAVSTDTDSNILATPSITTMDNEEASFVVGQEVPTITGSSVGNNNANPFQTVDRKEVGIKLKVTPQINEGKTVQMTIEQEVSGVSGTTAVDITINKRSIQTTVMADDGGTIVLGGLIDEDVQESESKVPLLGDIPILGHLFKSTSTSKKKRNLLVFIRPTIIRDRAKMNEISHRKYNYMRNEQLLQKEDGIQLMPLSDQPTLPSWDSALELPPTFEDYLQKQEKP